MQVGQAAAAQDRELVGDLGLHRHQLADLDARHVGLDGIELAPILARGVGLHVVHVEVRGPAAQENHDDRLVRRGLATVVAARNRSTSASVSPPSVMAPTRKKLRRVSTSQTAAAFEH